MFILKILFLIITCPIALAIGMIKAIMELY